MTLNTNVSRFAAVAALALTLAACGGGTSTSTDSTGTALSGNIAGAGASSQESAQTAWIAEFTNANPGVSVSYNPTGSGGGREQFIAGTVQFAGTDSALSPEEVAAAEARCGAAPFELPLYISPIAVVFNLDGIDSLNLSPDTIANIFAGNITNWNDPAIAADNPDVTLPDLSIIPVNRSDDSGTTDNFTEYLSQAAPSVWTYEPDGVWPIQGTQSGAQTSGLLDVVSSTQGTIGYVDASRAGSLGTVAVGVGEEFVPYSPEAAAEIFRVSQPSESATDTMLSYDLARDTQEAGVYPIVLVSYIVGCTQYPTADEAANVASYIGYIASPEGQDIAANPEVSGIAPISEDLRTQVQGILDSITAAQ